MLIYHIHMEYPVEIIFNISEKESKIIKFLCPNKCDYYKY